MLAGGKGLHWRKLMEIEDLHKKLLIEMGLKEEDFPLFDGKLVTYEYDAEKGVHLYDPYYRTSYNEYIGVDGWSAWSSEADLFMSEVFGAARAEAEKREKTSPRQSGEELAQALEKKFGKKSK
jgi:hypothetical protein